MPFAEDVGRFLADPLIQSLRDLARETRCLRICYPTEVPVSRFLTWVLDPTQGHGLGDGVLRALLTAAWRRRAEFEADEGVLEFLDPVQLEGETLEDCLVDREVPIGGGYLDVLVLDPRRKWLVAIEHKFGAAEGEGQLAQYRLGLEERFPGWRRVLVFLDWNGQPPNDGAWVGLDYEWLLHELKTAIASPWLAPSCKSVLQEFSDAVDWDAPQFVHVSNEQLLDAVVRHETVFREMLEWSGRGVLAALPEGPVRRKGADAIAAMQLQKVYWQRRELWNSCLEMLPHAAFLQGVRAEFPEVEHWTARKCVYFHLPAWSAVERPDPEDDNWAVAVDVFPLANAQRFGRDTFAVESYVAPHRWQPALLAQNTARLEQFRRLKKLPLDPGKGYYVLRSDKPVARSDAVALLRQQLRELNALMTAVATGP